MDDSSVWTVSFFTGELLAPVAAEAMEEAAVGEDVGATAGDADDSLQQTSVQLLETIDEPLTHDITGTFSGCPCGVLWALGLLGTEC